MIRKQMIPRMLTARTPKQTTQTLQMSPQTQSPQMKQQTATAQMQVLQMKQQTNPQMHLTKMQNQTIQKLRR